MCLLCFVFCVLNDNNDDLTLCRSRQANVLVNSDFNKRVFRAYDDETAVEVAWVEYNNLSPGFGSKRARCLFQHRRSVLRSC